MAWTIGNTVTVSVVFLNSDGSGATGLAASITTPLKRIRTGAGATVTFPTLSAWSHVGSGYYEATFLAATAGEHTIIASGGVGFLSYEWKEDVVTAAQADPAGAIGSQGLVLVQAGAHVGDAGALSIRRGDTTTWIIPLDTDLTGKTLWFAVKMTKPVSPTADLDDASASINAYWVHGGASAVRNAAGDVIGTIAVADPTEGTVVITLTAAYTSTLSGADGLLWEIQLKDGATITTWTSGTTNISTDLIRRTTVP